MPSTLLTAIALFCLLAGCSRTDAYAFRASPTGGPLPPNSVRVEAEVESCAAEENGSFACALRVDRVVEYGRGGPVMLIESTVEADFNRARLQLGGPPPAETRLDLLLIRSIVPGETGLRADRLYAVALP